MIADRCMWRDDRKAVRVAASRGAIPVGATSLDAVTPTAFLLSVGKGKRRAILWGTPDIPSSPGGSR